jgi:hypothetical protein
VSTDSTGEHATDAWTLVQDFARKRSQRRDDTTS